MNHKTLVERLRMTGKRISIPCPDGIDGCLVNHFRIETDPLCDEAADTIETLKSRIEALEAALRDIKIEAMREKGSWAHLKRVILLKCKQALEGTGNG